MGIKFAKNEVTASPVLQYLKKSNDTHEDVMQESFLEHNNQPDNGRNILKRRLLKSFSYNLCDPRSPGHELNRTPLVVEDNSEKNLNLDDTFADLFAESNIKFSAKTKTPIKSIERRPDLTIDEPHISTEDKCKKSYNDEPSIGVTPNQLKPVISQQDFDPRSPSIGVERTPIHFNIDNDYDDTMDDAMLENILSTLSLNVSNNANIANDSFASQNKNHSPIKDGKTKIKPYASRHNIYEDPQNVSTTTKKKVISDDFCGERTPLSCIRNHSRSRSLEPFHKLQQKMPKAFLKTTKVNLNALNLMSNP